MKRYTAHPNESRMAREAMTDTVFSGNLLPKKMQMKNPISGKSGVNMARLSVIDQD
jgi:hypothetical protein